MTITRRMLIAAPAALCVAQRRPSRKAAPKSLPEFRAEGLSIRVDSRRYQAVRAATFEEFREGGVNIDREAGRKVVLVELQAEAEQPAWFTIPSNDFRAEYATRDGLSSAPSLTFARSGQPLRMPPPGSFFVSNIKVEPGPLRFRVLFILPEGVTRFTLRLPASLLRDELRKSS